ncbi:MAG: hypothetical protein Q9228_000907 [Teloschistes exilis]
MRMSQAHSKAKPAVFIALLLSPQTVSPSPEKRLLDLRQEQSIAKHAPDPSSPPDFRPGGFSTGTTFTHRDPANGIPPLPSSAELQLATWPSYPVPSAFRNERPGGMVRRNGHRRPRKQRRRIGLGVQRTNFGRGPITTPPIPLPHPAGCPPPPSASIPAVILIIDDASAPSESDSGDAADRVPPLPASTKISVVTRPEPAGREPAGRYGGSGLTIFSTAIVVSVFYYWRLRRKVGAEDGGEREGKGMRSVGKDKGRGRDGRRWASGPLPPPSPPEQLAAAKE